MSKHHFERLKAVDHLIRIKGTGSPDQLARRLQISNRALYEFLQLMKDLGGPIKYCKDRRSYYYDGGGGFEFKFKQGEEAQYE